MKRDKLYYLKIAAAVALAMPLLVTIVIAFIKHDFVQAVLGGLYIGGAAGFLLGIVVVFINKWKYRNPFVQVLGTASLTTFIVLMFRAFFPGLWQ